MSKPTGPQAGILLVGRDEVIESRAKRHHVALTLGDRPDLPFERTLITRPGTAVPWELLPAAWGLLEAWDAAVPLWAYPKTAVSVGKPDEREMTRLMVRDLRVLLHATELLFVRRNEAGDKLLESWRLQMPVDGDERLAFLRALTIEKPRLCVLPTSWISGSRVTVTAQPARRQFGPGEALVLVDLGNGRFVKCHAGDERKVRLMFSADRRHSEMAIVSKSSFAVENQKTRASKGPLVRIELQPGRFVKMYEVDAIALGHIQPRPKPETKERPAQEDKLRPTEGDKAATGSATGEPAPAAGSGQAAAQSGDGAGAAADIAESSEASAAEPDDLTRINGVGLATARLLNSHGIFTFDQLRTADVGFLAPLQQQAVEDWRNNG